MRFNYILFINQGNIIHHSQSFLLRFNYILFINQGNNIHHSETFLLRFNYILFINQGNNIHNSQTFLLRFNYILFIYQGKNINHSETFLLRFNYILFINADNVIQHIYYPEQIRSKTILLTTEFECKLGITWEQIRSKTILITTKSSLPSAYYIYLQHKNTSPQFTKVIFVTLKSHFLKRESHSHKLKKEYPQPVKNY